MEDPDFPVEVHSAAVLPLVRAWRLDRSFRYSIPDDLKHAIEIGSLVRVPLGPRKVRGIVMELSERPQGDLEAIQSLVVRPSLAPVPMRDLLTWVANRYAAPLPTAFERVVPQRIRVKPRVAGTTSDGPPLHRLTRYQGGAELAAAVSGGAVGVWCLRSVAGEDRARLISELVASARRAAGTALVLVPEIHYGSRVLDGLQENFPACLRLDSGQVETDRASAWLGMAAGHPLGAGGRGSVLVPTPGLRLIVVDEEHHRTYKEDRSPRYDARRVAIERARLQGAICVLISVAPLLETGASVESGAFRIAEPDRATDRAARPIIELIEKPGDRLIAHDLHRRMHDCLGNGGKVAVLVPQRGYARSLWCGSCRRSFRCPVCEAGVRLEGGGTGVRCPRCGWSAATPSKCPSCGAAEFRLVGAGSERVAEQLAAMFPRASVGRVDPDTLESGEGRVSADIYVTTWIGTKPTLRPDVSLVAVLDADGLIRMPDFRAAENAYRALAEMAEWAGSAATGGRLLIQTAEPSHHAIQAVVRADYRFFLHRELEQRRDLWYPPFAELMKVRSSGNGHLEVIQEVAERCKALRARVLGPISVGGTAGSAVVPGAEVLIKHPDIERVAQCVRVILPKVPAGTRLRVDVDPR